MNLAEHLAMVISSMPGARANARPYEVPLGLATADIPAGADVYVHVLAWTPAQAAFGFEFARFLTGEGAPGQPRLGRARGAVLYGQMVLTSDLEIDP